MRKTYSRNSLFGGDSNNEKFSHKHRAQPRKSEFRTRRQEDYKHAFDYDDGESQGAHRREPAKNLVRVQLRRIQQMF